MSSRSQSFASLFTFIQLIASVSFAAGEVIPEFKNDEERDAFIGQVRRQVPFAQYTSADRVSFQQYGINALREKFPEYDKWMEAKPSPIVIELFEQEFTNETTYLLNDKQVQALQQQVAKIFSSEIASLAKSKDEVLLAELQKRALQQLKNILQSSGNSVRGLMVGVAQILPPQERGAFLKLGDPKLQLDALKRMNISDESLQKSAFKAATLGLQQDSVTMSQVLEIASAKLNQSDSLFSQLSYLKFLSKLADQDIRKARPSELLEAADFEFAIQEADSFLETTVERFKDLFASENTGIEKSIEIFKASIPRQAFQQAQLQKRILKPLGTVYEVHPYLGIHRGCIGGDCSTTTSPMFPYSPWEHDFYIKNAEGRFVGYISGTRIKADGVDSFYMRDLQGPNISPKLAEAILHAFPHAMNHFGVKQFVVAGPQFINAQNNSIPLRQVFGKYNSVPVNLEFIDTPVRDYIGNNNRVFSSNYGYDDPAYHLTGAIFRPHAEFDQKFVAKIRLGTLPIPDLRTRGQAFLGAMRLAIKNTNIALDAKEFPEIPAHELAYATALLINQNRLPLATYYRGIDDMFQKYGIEFNKEFRENNEDLFTIGHLKASDAFLQDADYLHTKFSGAKVDDRKGSESIFTKISERYLIQMSRKHQNFPIVMEVVNQNQKILSESKRFRELIHFYAQRMLPNDVFQLQGFAAAGIAEAEELLFKTAQKNKVEAAVIYVLKNGVEGLGLAPGGGSFASTLYQYFNQPQSYYPDQLRTAFEQQLLTGLNLDAKQIQSVELNSLLIGMYLRTHQFFSSSNESQLRSMIEILMKIPKELRPSRNLFFVFEWYTYRGGNKELATPYLHKLAESGGTIDILELVLFKQMRYTEADEILKKPEMRDKIMQLIEKVTEHPAAPEFLEFTNLYNQIPRTTNFIWHFNIGGLGGTVQNVLQVIDQVANLYNLTAKDLLRNPRIRKSMAPWWPDLSDAFSTPSSELLQFSLSNLLEKMKSNNHLVVQKNTDDLIQNFDYLKQKPFFATFLHEVHQLAISGQGMNAAYLLSHLIQTGKIPDRISQHKIVLEKLVATNQPTALAFAFARAYERKIPFRMTDEIAAHLLGALATFANSPVYPNIQKDILNVLRQAKGNRPHLHANLLAFAKANPSNQKALLAAMAYLSNGGQPKEVSTTLTSYYDRSELSNPGVVNEDSRLYERYLSTLHRGTKSCAQVFH